MITPVDRPRSGDHVAVEQALSIRRRCYTAYYWDLRGRQRSAGTFTRLVNLASGRQRFARYVAEVWLPKPRHGTQHPPGLPTGHPEVPAGRVRANADERDPARPHPRLPPPPPDQRRLGPHRSKTVLSAISTTALNDQVIYFHPCTGAKGTGCSAVLVSSSTRRRDPVREAISRQGSAGRATSPANGTRLHRRHSPLDREQRLVTLAPIHSQPLLTFLRCHRRGGPAQDRSSSIYRCRRPYRPCRS
ncbi:hypothetical protein SAMN05216215_104541 [Saccharopolyspora shandongensis]|uniref:Uncharacterized protein n=1 Tax=Saccharopolyspora shandongensis TaxID=418495 RepID=A0A1H3Q2E8_9PSEU|nr:hypothetical protein SAMN05216215_104541 [Saccharopolyspora shandongensis]